MPILLRPSTSAAKIIGGPIRRAPMNNGTVGTSLIAGVTVDGPNRDIYTPLTTAEFSAIGASTPDYFWPCSETSGNIVTTIGSLTLTTNGTNHLYQQTISGWTRKAVGSTNDNETACWRALSGSGPNPQTQSCAWLGYFLFPSAPANIRTFLNVKGAAPQVICRMQDTGVLNINVNAVAVNGTYNYVDGNVHPIVLDYNKTAGTARVYTDKEMISTTYMDVAGDGNKGIGGVTGNSNNIYRCLWLAAYAGTNAQQDWNAYLRALRWNLAY